MAKSSVLIACLLTLVAGNALAQSFPSKPVTLICPCTPANIPDRYLRALAQIASKYLGQPVTVATITGENETLGPATMAGTARPYGYTLSRLTINSFRVPHIERTIGLGR
jgi:tripartite-type tricarboxylate transporter receptor subunit TctC